MSTYHHHQHRNRPIVNGTNHLKNCITWAIKQKNDDFVFLVHEQMTKKSKRKKDNISIVYTFELLDSNEHRHDAMSDNAPFFVFFFLLFLNLFGRQFMQFGLAYLLLNIDVSNECMCVADVVDVDVLSFLICTRDRLPRSCIYNNILAHWSDNCPWN